MSIERHDEPAVLHALEEAQEALRTEQRAREPLSRENTRLQARLEQLRAERDQLLRAVDGKEERPHGPSRLPEALEPPFAVQAQAFPRQQVRRFLPVPVLTLLMLAVVWNHDPRIRMFNLVVLLGVLVYQGVKFGWGRWWTRWRFESDGFEGGKWQGRSRFVRYSDVVRVEVYVSASQRRRGVGTVVVTSKPWPMSGQLCVQLKDVPEPERLAAWLQRRRTSNSQLGAP